MLPVVMAAAHYEPILRPDYLGANLEPTRNQAVGHRAGMERGVPDICHLAGEQSPGLAPICPVVIGDSARTS